MIKIYENDKIQIWAVRESWGMDYWVYGIFADPKVCPSLDFATAFVASYAEPATSFV